LSDFVSASESQNTMQVAPCTLHDDSFQRADHTKVTPLYEENVGTCQSSNNKTDRHKTGLYGMSIIQCYKSKQKRCQWRSLQCL